MAAGTTSLLGAATAPRCKAWLLTRKGTFRRRSRCRSNPQEGKRTRTAATASCKPACHRATGSSRLATCGSLPTTQTNLYKGFALKPRFGDCPCDSLECAAGRTSSTRRYRRKQSCLHRIPWRRMEPDRSPSLAALPIAATALLPPPAPMAFATLRFADCLAHPLRTASLSGPAQAPSARCNSATL